MAMKFVACVSNDVGELSGDDLTLGCLYEVLSEEKDCYRLIDDSGEDFFYPKSCFEEVSLTAEAAQRLHEAIPRRVA